MTRMTRSALTVTLALAMVASLAAGMATPSQGAQGLELVSLTLSGQVNLHYAVTTVEQIIENQGSQGAEALFKIQLPDTAFISNLTWVRDGVAHYGEVAPSNQAQQQYEQAKEEGNMAGLLETRGKQLFAHSVYLNASSNATVKITYEQFLPLRLGAHTYRLPLNPDASNPIPLVEVRLKINSAEPIESLEATGYQGIETAGRSTYQATVNFSARNLAPLQDLVVSYTTSEAPRNGSMLFHTDMATNTTYFLHRFGPGQAELGGHLDREVVFLLDKSGSMGSGKLNQLKEAFDALMTELPDTDRFNVVAYDSSVDTLWSQLQPASSANKQAATEYVSGLRASGGTDINSALYQGLELVGGNTTRLPIVILLTDGEPTAGVKDTDRIRSNALDLNRQAGGLIYTLGFGSDVDFSFLEALALENGGVAQPIYPGQDVPDQLTAFHSTIATPLLRDLTLAYENGADFHPATASSLFVGSELVVVGRVTGSGPLVANLSALGASGPVTFQQSFVVPSAAHNPYLPRMAAYLEIASLLDQMAAFGETEAGKARVMELAQEWNFVTPYTAMVVTESGPSGDPEDPGSTNDPEDTSTDDPNYYPYEDPTTEAPAGDDDASNELGTSSVSSILVVGVLALLALTLRRRK